MKKLFFISLCIISFILVAYTTSTVQPNTALLPPLEVYVIDQKTKPKRDNKQNNYTAQIFIVNNIKKQVFGPFKGSSFPNNYIHRETVIEKGKKKVRKSGRPNTISEGIHYFNNKNGHKGGLMKGLNIDDSKVLGFNNYKGNRYVIGFSINNTPTVMQYVNVHAGFSNKGGSRSRGSEGCITLHPDQADDFFKHFEFSSSRVATAKGSVVTKDCSNAENCANFISKSKKRTEEIKKYNACCSIGTSEGILYVYRNTKEKRDELIKQIKNIYPQ